MSDLTVDPSEGAEHSGAPADGTPIKDPEAIFQMLAAAETRRRRQPAASKRALIIATVAIPIALVIGLIIGAHYLENLAATTTNDTVGGAQSNLNSALAASERYVGSHETLDGVTSTSGLSALAPSLTFPTVSGSATEIALDLRNSGALVMTSLQSSPDLVCFGVAQVVGAQPSPVFTGYPSTADPGIYYFEAPTVGGECDSYTVTPPGGGSFVSTTGFPSAPLP
jgi:hypothetical protein